MNRKILLGVTGSIAAYKAVELVRLFIKNGDSVQVVMTPAACEFVKPLTFQTLSRNPVYVDQFAPPVSWKPEHISLAESAMCSGFQLTTGANCSTYTGLRESVWNVSGFTNSHAAGVITT